MPAVLRLPVATVPLLEDACEQFLAECRLRGLSPRTLVWYEVTLGPFVRHAATVGCRRPDEVREEHVRDFLADQQTRVSARRVNHYRDALRTFFAWALDEGYTAINPAARFRKVREPRRVIATFGEADLEALLAQPDPKTFIGLRDLTFMLLLLDTGVRLAEAVGLRLDDIDLPGLTLKVLGKGSKERLVGFSPMLAPRLQTYLTRRASAFKSVGLRDGGALFVNVWGAPAKGHTLWRQIRVYGERAGLAHVRVTPHTFRHSFAVWFMRNGGTPFHLQRCLGHEDLAMSRRYCELADVDYMTKQRELSLLGSLRLDSGRPRLTAASGADREAEGSTARPGARRSASNPSRPAPPAHSTDW
jgi:site-specific recombinase XerD